MQDKLLISRNIKITIEYVEKILDNCPKNDLYLKDEIYLKFYNMLELSYRYNVFGEETFLKEILVNMRMIEYYLKKLLKKNIISYKKYEIIGKYILEITKMIYGLIKYNETNK